MVTRILREILARLEALKHRFRLKRLGSSREREYQHYLRLQLERTLVKRHATTGTGAQILIDKLVDTAPPEWNRVLCIGCRNRSELEYFKSKGKSAVVGIDLFSTSSGILVMDMHAMDFAAASFDLIFSSHSLEHSYDLPAVVREIVRVAKPGAWVAVEVPVCYATTPEDLIDFKDLDTLHAAFAPYLAEVVWSEQQPPRTPRNEHGNQIIRTIFTLRQE
jgi:SAM-dependent methyltransferase